MPARLGLSARGQLSRAALLSGMGLQVAAFAWTGAALAAPFGSPGWFAEHGNGGSAGRQAAPVAGATGGTPVVTPVQAIQRANRSIVDLTRAAEGLAAMQAAQTAAHQLAASSGPGCLIQNCLTAVRDGLDAQGAAVTASTGLQIAADVPKDLANVQAGENAAHWINAKLPTQTVDSGKTTVTVEQTDQRAVLYWDSFNIGRNTTLHFDQSSGTQKDGSNSWIALNKVGNTASASQILGNIKAEGSVYLINNNGILFGGSSQINVHSLIATSLNPVADQVAAVDQRFLDYAGTGDGVADKTQPFFNSDANRPYAVLEGNGSEGAVTIAAGAQIVTDSLGYSMFAAPTVRNDGVIIASDGQVVLAQGKGVRAEPAVSGSASNAMKVSVTGQSDDPTAFLVNTGLIQSRRGDITLSALNIDQQGVLLATTSISRAGSIALTAGDDTQLVGNNATTGAPAGVLNRYGQLRLSGNSLTALLPDENGETTTSSAAATAAFNKGSITLSGGAVTFKSGAQVEAPGQNLVVQAAPAAGDVINLAAATGAVAGRIYVDSGAILDVSGLNADETALNDLAALEKWLVGAQAQGSSSAASDLTFEMSANAVTIARVGQNELADVPLQRDGILYRSSITVDRRVTGKNADGSTWTGTALANVLGYIEQVPRVVDQLLVDAGSVSLKGAEVLLRAGSIVNLDGGYVHYLGGTIETTRVVAANGAVFDIGAADPDQVYVAFAGKGTQTQSRWNTTDVYGNGAIDNSNGVYESAYIEGGNAGHLTIGGTDAMFLEGTLSAQALAGRHQVADGTLPNGGTLTLLADAASGAGWYPAETPLLVDALGHGFDVRSSVATLDSLVAGFDAASSLDGIVRTPVTDAGAEPWNDPTLLSYWTPLSATQLNSMGLSTLELKTGTALRVESGAALTVRDGGTIKLQGASVYLGANLTARSGSIDVTSTGATGAAGYNPYYMYAPTVDATGGAVAGDIEVDSGVTLDASGRWINDTGLGADAINGGAYVNGGSISLSAQTAPIDDSQGVKLVSGRRDVTNPNEADFPVYAGVDLTGSVILDRSSLLDVSSGGRVATNGQLVASSAGIVQGKGGDISLRTYAGEVPDLYSTNADTGVVTHLPSESGSLQLGGSLRAYGFSGGGTLTLEALGIRIGESDSAATAGTLQLASSFFSTQGFGSYKLIALYDASVTAGTTVTVSEQNLLPTYGEDGTLALYQLATGASLYASSSSKPAGYVRVGSLDIYDREAADFSMTAGWYLLANNAFNYRSSGITGTLLVDEGAAINADARANVLLGSVNQLTMLGSITAHGGSVTLTGDTVGAGYSLLDTDGILGAFSPYTSASKSVWLGVNSLIDVSGVYLQNPRLAQGIGVIKPTRDGLVLDGGSVTLTADNGWVVALGCSDVQSKCSGKTAPAGATINVSGTKAVLDISQGSLFGDVAASTVYSNGGSVRLGAGTGLYYNGKLKAAGGSTAALGGALYITAENTASGYQNSAKRIVLSNEVIDLPGNTLTAGSPIDTGSRGPGYLFFASDRLDGAGVADLYIGSDDAIGVGKAVPVAFKTDTRIAVSRSIHLSSSLAAVGNVPAAGASGYSSTISLSAPYISLLGADLGERGAQVDDFPEAKTGITLSINADNIDIGGQLALRNFGTVSFNATNDIRLVTPSLHANYSGAVVDAGYLYSQGNLQFTSAQVYVATANRFIIDSEGGSVAFTGNAQSATAAQPLSAGGSLIVDAAKIVQGGVLRVPQGEIVLGLVSGDESLLKIRTNDGGVDVLLPYTATQSVTLLDGSITSVSLGGLTVPYGTTTDGLNWSYDGSLGIGGTLTSTALPLSAPPSKSIRISAGSVDLSASGAVVDLGGGGELQAQEFVAGVGGTRNVLADYNTTVSNGSLQQSSQYADGRAVYAIVPGYSSSSLAAYDPALVTGAPLVGKAVYLSGVPGLPAGVYTLLPAAYATLKGAYRIVQDTAAVDTTAGINSALPDGTQLVAGRFVDALTGSKAARDTRFYVQSSEAWQQYSSYKLTSADDYYAAAAASAGTATPALPRDAGQLVLAATSKLKLGAGIDGAAGTGGRGAQIDIASSAIEILADGATASTGYLGIAASALTALDADSLLIGGTRTQTDDGTLINAVASSIRVDNSGNTLSAGELQLVTTGKTSSDGITLLDDAELQADGTRSADSTLLIGNSSTAGDGAYLRLGAGSSTLTRSNVTSNGYGALSIGDGVKFSAASLALDATGTTQIGNGAGFDVDALSVTAPRIGIVGSNASSQGEGFIVNATSLAALSSASSLTLQARQQLDVLGTFNFTLAGALSLSAPRIVSDGGTAALTAQSLRIDNVQGGSVSAADAGSGTLQLQAQRIDIAGADKTLSGFGTIAANATQGLAVHDAGTTDFGAANVQLTAPVIVAETGSKAVLKTSAAMNLSSSTSGTLIDDSAIGGSLALQAAQLKLDTRVQATGGALALQAGGSGDALQLGSAARLDVSGVSQTYFDVQRQASAGSVRLLADAGNVDIASGAVIDIAADAAGGDAGSLQIQSAGSTTLAGTVQAARSTGKGASFKLDSGGAVALDALAATLGAGGVDGSIAVRSTAGDLQLSSGKQLSADAVSLTADAGTVRVDGSILAVGEAGGSITLQGRKGVDVEGVLDAHGTSATQRGGSVVLGTSASFDTSKGYNADYGYENIGAADAGVITLGKTARIDVSGGTAGGLSGGVLKLRAPLLQDGEVPVQLAAGFDAASQIKGAREVSLEAYATWSTTDSSSGSQHFDGIIDAAGRHDAAGAAVDANADHLDFYQSTLAGFVQQPGFAFENRLSALGAYVARPGIELVNPSGDIAVLSNWNLGAGTRNSDGSLKLMYRYQGSIAPVLTLRAAGDLNVDASISDGFFQYNNPFSGSTTNIDNSASPESITSNPLALASASLMARVTVDADGNSVIQGYDSSSLRFVAGADTASADPLALARGAADSGTGSLTLDGHSTGITFNTKGEARSILAPTMIRTGVGSIDIATAGDITLKDADAPGVIYTAGTPDPDAPAPTLIATIKSSDVASASSSRLVYSINSGLVNPVAAGDLSVSAGGDINGVEHIVDTDGSRSGKAGTELGQAWWQWMDSDATSAPTLATRSSINFGNFDQGLLSVGGNVHVSAAGDIRDLGVSSSATWYLTGDDAYALVGGGRLDVSAGGDILSGTYQLVSGVGSVSARGSIIANGDIPDGTTPIATWLGVQHGQLSVTAAGDVTIAGVYADPRLGYSSDSALSLQSTSGDIDFEASSVLPVALSGENYLASVTNAAAQASIFPATLSLTALSGSVLIDNVVKLSASASGNLDIIVADDVRLNGRNSRLNDNTIGLLDADESAMSSPLNQLATNSNTLDDSDGNGGTGAKAIQQHSRDGLHAGATEPVRIYSRDGDIVDGTATSLGSYNYTATLIPNKPAYIRAGRDIVNLSFRGQNLKASDITLIQAGRDLYDAPLVDAQLDLNQRVVSIEVGGPGAMIVEAGRNLGAITSTSDARNNRFFEETPGIRSVGNLYNPWLTRGDGATLDLRYGIGPGAAVDAFATAYLNPSASTDYASQLIDFVKQYQRDQGVADSALAETAAQAWAIYVAMPQERRSLLVSEVFLALLNQVGLDYNDSNSLYYKQYARGYAAIETLFPAALGYTANTTGTGGNGAAATVTTGIFDMRGSTVQTQQGGDIRVLGPGGRVLVGSQSAPAYFLRGSDYFAIPPSEQGILAVQTGSIGIFADDSVLLAQSRIFTQQGGDLLIWSSNGDINAGQGAKTNTERASQKYICYQDQFCIVDARGQVSGAGIAALQSDPSKEAGDANLIAPRGTVDAGDAGIRAANLNIAALRVANADNVQVSGSSSGIPTGATDTGALASASSVAAAVSKTADDMAASKPVQTAATVITVEVVGFGSPSEEQRRSLR